MVNKKKYRRLHDQSTLKREKETMRQNPARYYAKNKMLNALLDWTSPPVSEADWGRSVKKCVIYHQLLHKCQFAAHLQCRPPIPKEGRNGREVCPH